MSGCDLLSLFLSLSLSLSIVSEIQVFVQSMCFVSEVQVFVSLANRIRAISGWSYSLVMSSSV